MGEIAPLGVGINLLPHAVRVLDCLGVERRLAGGAVETAALAYYNRHGQQIWSEPRGRAAGYRPPSTRFTAGVSRWNCSPPCGSGWAIAR
ncbi:MAG TPA: hypothetical protein VMU66_01245 [Gaiellales bacterium]|nr:hypothetical protein [Gaiellales bacterium]